LFSFVLDPMVLIVVINIENIREMNNDKIEEQRAMIPEEET